MANRQVEHGFTLIELLLVVAIIGIFATVAVPGLLRARMAGNEATAAASLGIISHAQTTFADGCAKGGYAESLEALARPPEGQAKGFVGPDLSMNGINKSGYFMAVAADRADDTYVMEDVAPCNGSPAPVSSFFASADPINPGGTGIRYFAIDPRGMLVDSAARIGNPLIVPAAVR